MEITATLRTAPISEVPLYLCLAQGIAIHSKGFRAGARHNLIVIVAASRLETAHRQAIERAERAGWGHVVVERLNALDFEYGLLSEELRRAATAAARQQGSCLAIYRDEIPLNS